jgi:hypothetical protein
LADAATTGKDILTKRKAYIVPFIQPSPQAPDGFTQRFNAYWQAVDKQVSALEARAGVVKRIFAEGILGKGDDALLMLDQSNPQAHRIVKSRVDAGARFDEYEDDDLFAQVVDWSRCLSIGFISESVATAVTASYQDAVQRRQRHLDKRLEEGLKEGEAALLLSGTTNLKLPDDVEKFLVAPPELDELERWIRSVNEAIRRQQAQGAAGRGQHAGHSHAAPPPPPREPQGGNAGSKLWTPGS